MPIQLTQYHHESAKAENTKPGLFRAFVFRVFVIPLGSRKAAWQACTQPDKMLQILLRRGGTSERKLRLFACACCRRILRFQTDDRSRAAVEAAEEYADGLSSIRELSTPTAAEAGRAATVVSVGPKKVAARAERLADWEAAAEPPAARDAARAAALAQQAQVFRDIMGNPFRPSKVDPAVLAWQGGMVPELTQAIYDGRAFDRLSVLADALEEAGCQDADILAHCRGRGPHVRGCWVVDLLLGIRSQEDQGDQLNDHLAPSQPRGYQLCKDASP